MPLKGIAYEGLETESPADENHWGLRAKPKSLGNFCNFFKKNSRFNALQIKFCTILESFERTTISGADLCWALGGIICNFTPILPYFQHWGGWTSTTILFRCGNLVKTKKKNAIGKLFSPNSGEDQKKRSSSKIEHFFPQIYAQMYTHSNYWGGCRCRPFSKYWGGIQPNYWGRYIPPLFRHPWLQCKNFWASWRIKLLSPFCHPLTHRTGLEHLKRLHFWVKFFKNLSWKTKSFLTPPSRLHGCATGWVFLFRKSLKLFENYSKTLALPVILACQSISCGYQICFPTPREGWGKVSVNNLRIF